MKEESLKTISTISPEGRKALSESTKKQMVKQRIKVGIRNLFMVSAVCPVIQETPSTIWGRDCQVKLGRKNKIPMKADIIISKCPLHYSTKGKYPVNFVLKGGKGHYESCDIQIIAGKERRTYKSKKIYISAERKESRS
jgi:hypothetical protein